MSAGAILLAYCLFTVSLFLIGNLTAHLVISGLLACALPLLPRQRLRGGLLPIALFLLFTFLSNLFSSSGRVLFSLGSLLVTDEGLRLAGVRTLRVFDLIFAAKVLASLARLEELLAALGRFFRPLERLGAPVHEFFLVLTLTLQCFPALTRRLSDAYRERVRGRSAVAFSEKVRLTAAFLVPLFVESMRTPEKFFTPPEQPEKAGDA